MREGYGRVESIIKGREEGGGQGEGGKGKGREKKDGEMGGRRGEEGGVQ